MTKTAVGHQDEALARERLRLPSRAVVCALICARLLVIARRNRGLRITVSGPVQSVIQLALL
jgi:hypothetical protein